MTNRKGLIALPIVLVAVRHRVTSIRALELLFDRLHFFQRRFFQFICATIGVEVPITVLQSFEQPHNRKLVSRVREERFQEISLEAGPVLFIFGKHFMDVEILELIDRYAWLERYSNHVYAQQIPGLQSLCMART